MIKLKAIDLAKYDGYEAGEGALAADINRATLIKKYPPNHAFTKEEIAHQVDIGHTSFTRTQQSGKEHL